MTDQADSQVWLPGFLQTSPMFEPLCEVGEPIGRLPHWPGIESLNPLLVDRKCGIATKSGKPIRFVPQAKTAREFVQQYEPRIYLTGEIQTREHNWHDLFNALAWLAYPRAKAALNHLHYHALRQESGRNKLVRSPLRDAVTLIDESGVVVVSSSEYLMQLLRNHEWKTLFWKQRAAVQVHMKFFLFGHGLYEKALRPYLGMTGKGMLFHVSETFFNQRVIDQVGMMDVWLDHFLSCTSLTSADLVPVPVLGYPGWSLDNADAVYYDNQHYFRPRTMKKSNQHRCIEQGV